MHVGIEKPVPKTHKALDLPELLTIEAFRLAGGGGFLFLKLFFFFGTEEDSGAANNIHIITSDRRKTNFILLARAHKQ